MLFAVYCVLFWCFTDRPHKTSLTRSRLSIKSHERIILVVLFAFVSLEKRSCFCPSETIFATSQKWLAKWRENAERRHWQGLKYIPFVLISSEILINLRRAMCVKWKCFFFFVVCLGKHEYENAVEDGFDFARPNQFETNMANEQHQHQHHSPRPPSDGANRIRAHVKKQW